MWEFEYFLIIWFGVILLSFFIEAQSAELVSVWFGFGAILTFILTLFGIPFYWQIGNFLVVSTVLMLFLRPIVKRHFMKHRVPTNLDSLVGKKATCTKVIEIGERGEVKVSGKYWSAITEEKQKILVGESAEILAIDGNKLVVKK